jgi:hypothetical protein
MNVVRREMDEIEDVELEYAMLEYLFVNRKLAKSCFNYTWEDFLIENQEYEDYTPDQLKTLFWTAIAPNISGLLIHFLHFFFNNQIKF